MAKKVYKIKDELTCDLELKPGMRVIAGRAIQNLPDANGRIYLDGTVNLRHQTITFNGNTTLIFRSYNNVIDGEVIEGTTHTSG